MVAKTHLKMLHSIDFLLVYITNINVAMQICAP